MIKDSVEIAWKIYSLNGSILHDSRKQLINESDGVNNQLFQFKIGNDPREVVLAFEYAVKSMFEGEIASYIISPRYGFGEKGAPIIGIMPNMTLICDIELVNIIPSLTRKFKSVGYNESIKDELIEQIQTGLYTIL